MKQDEVSLMSVSHSIDDATRAAMYARSLDDPDGFWLEQARLLDWIKAPTKAGDWSFDEGDFHVRWFEDGVLNATANCLDRHLATRGDQTAILWEPDDPKDAPRHFTYAKVHREVCRFANVLKALGAKKGDRITLYLPMIPEAAFALLACARIGAIHSVVFGGFSADALAGRMEDCGSRLVVTADEGRRGGKHVPLKAQVDEAATIYPGIETVLVIRSTGGEVAMQAGRDLWYHDEAAKVGTDCPPEPMAAEDPLFILYTSGSTGKPKGVMHTTGGYMVWAALTHAKVFDYRAPDIFWCAADIGWVTGHSYILYAPLANGATTLMYEGVPNWPTPSRIWEIVDRHQVSTLYTAPTALRALMKEGDEFVTRTSRKSLKLLGSVGEPINPEAWRWYHEVVGESRCPILDTWWQTETGGHTITPYPRPRSSRDRRRSPSSGWSPSCSTARGMSCTARRRAVSSSRAPGLVRCALCGATASASSKPISAPSPASTPPATARAAMPTAITGSPAVSTT